MSIGTRLNNRLTGLAVSPGLPRRTVRMRLTLLYGGLFLLSGAALLAITYTLVVNATAGYLFTNQNGAVAVTRAQSKNPAPPSTGVQIQGTVRNSAKGTPPRLPTRLSPQQAQAQATELITEGGRQHTRTLHQLLIQSGIALAGMSLLSIALGWLIAGRVLQPLEDSYQAQRRFVANASHELRTPLARQRALIQVALADPDASFRSLRTAHERVLASEEQLEQLIEALLMLTRGQVGLHSHEAFDLAELTDRVALARNSDARPLGLNIERILTPAGISGDPRLVERLIANLIDNALRHNVPDGRVTLAVVTRGARAVLSVTNTGPVVPRAAVDQLFEPFRRLGADRAVHRDGVGLGLSIVQAIANAHHATLAVDPQPKGGLRIDVSFPAAAAAPVATDPPARQPLARLRRHRNRAAATQLPRNR